MVTIRAANPDDVPAIVEMLQDNDLRPEGVLENGTRYWVAEEGERTVGAIGLELGTSSVLLRSAVVVPWARGKGTGQELTAQALRWAWASGYRVAYCFSTEAGGYWIARGFRECPVAEVIGALPDAPQVQLFGRLNWLPTEIAFCIGRPE